MSVRELYQQVIVDHGTQPRNLGRCESPTCEREGRNPLCGDHLTVSVQYTDGRIQDIQFEGSGCAISMASASLMTEALRGKSKEEALALFDAFHRALTSDDEVEAASLGKLAVLAGVREYPMRVKCATLAWHTMKALWDDVSPMGGQGDGSMPISTES